MAKTKKPRPDIADMETTNNDLSQGEALTTLSRQVSEFVEAMRGRVRNANSMEDVFKAILDGNWSRRVVMLTPFNRPINPHAHYAMMAHIRQNPWLGYDYEPNTVIQRARNYLADRFLKSEAEWSWWVDQDTIAPFGSPGFFYKTLGAQIDKLRPEFLQVSAIQKLMQSEKFITGAVYDQRKPNGRLVIQPDLHPRGDGDKTIVKTLREKGPQRHVIKVDWVATGCALIHRKVYEDIKEAHPELKPKDENLPWDFFGHDTNASGEDIHFCKLAKEAGHDSYLDCSLFCGHLGETCYIP